MLGGWLLGGLPAGGVGARRLPCVLRPLLPESICHPTAGPTGFLYPPTTPIASVCGGKAGGGREGPLQVPNKR